MIAHGKTFVVATAFDNECLLLVNNLTKNICSEQKIVKNMKVFPLECFAIYGMVNH